MGRARRSFQPSSPRYAEWFAQSKDAPSPSIAAWCEPEEPHIPEQTCLASSWSELLRTTTHIAGGAVTESQCEETSARCASLALQSHLLLLLLLLVLLLRAFTRSHRVVCV